MKKLNRQGYNELIKELNAHSNPEKDIESLYEKYQEVLCHLPDYEELVMLVNLCIAEDRGNKFDELYVHYRQIEEIISKHSGWGLHNAYELYYCVGMFSFKFHYYERAADYFDKCIKDIKRRGEDPLSHDPTRDYFINSMILISYTLEYDKKTNGACKAINNILNDKKIDVVNMQVKELCRMSPDRAVQFFFEDYPSKIYEAANDDMKREIIHMLAHCFSEYATCLRGSDDVKFCDVYFWEILSEKFIEYLGNDMVTCRATILAEHGHYHQALNLLQERYNALSSNQNISEKAEIAFYIYYFSNRIGLDDDNIQNCKDEFLSYAAENESKDTKLYAWITKFRAEFSKTVSMLSRENIEKLEEVFEEGLFDSNAHSYVHPQIQEEEKRLQLAYQIIRSYTLINDNDNAANDSDNSLFEKCVLFNTLSSERNVAEESLPLPNDIPENIDILLYIHGIALCVYGISSKLLNPLSQYFHTEIRQAKKNTMGHQKILILSDETQLSKFNANPEEEILAYYVYCENEELKKEIQKKVSIDNDNCILFPTPEDAFRVAYIQETIERCYVCVHRWGEYFIMAPITDNSTFAFQSQIIREYLEIKDDAETEKEIFSDENGYVSSDFSKPASVKKFQYKFSLAKEPTNSTWRAFFYHKNWVYRFDRDENVFVPETFCENRGNIVNQFEQLCEQRPTRSNIRRKNCNCQMKQSKCACKDYYLSKDYSISKVREEVDNYLMSLSLSPIQEGESICSLIFPENWEKGPVDCFMLILSSARVLDSSLRESFNKLTDICKSSSDYKEATISDTEELTSATPVTSICEDGFDETRTNLLFKIKAYQDTESDNLSSEDQNRIADLSSRVENCSDFKSLIQLETEWEFIQKGK